MDKIRVILILFHILITVFLIYQRHPADSPAHKSSETENQISSVIVYINDSFRITFYHVSCIIAIWYSRRHAAGMIRATGVLLIGEFLEILSITIKHLLETDHISHTELVFDILYFWLFLGAIGLTYRLAKAISKFHKDLLQIELLHTTTGDLSVGGGGEFSLV